MSLSGLDSQLLWVTARAFVITLIATPVCRDIFSSYSIVDSPDQVRKIHGRPIPRVGGIAILIGYVLSFVLFGVNLDQKVEHELSLVWKLFPAVLLVFGIGLIDDFIGLKPWQKLAGQLAAALLAYWSGVRVWGVAGYDMSSVWWSLPITLVWLLLCTNAFNLVDGLDGLAAGVGFFATLTTFVAALLYGNVALAFATLPLAGALLGFLCFNFNPATIFLGDGGSLLIGFLLGCFGAIWSQKSATLLGVTAPLIALSIPLLDVILCIVRRFLRNKPIFTADRGHIHHRLLELGLTPRRAVLAIYGATGLAAAVSLLQSLLPNVYMATGAVVLFAALIWGIVRFLGYAEFILAGRILRTGGFQRLVTAQIELEEFRKALRTAPAATGAWPVLRDWYQRLGFDAVAMKIDGHTYEVGDQTPSSWTIHVPIEESATITFAKNYGTAAPIIVSALVEMLHMELSNRTLVGPAPETVHKSLVVHAGGEAISG
jgi:UDP-GlcNAc:undecaprenyl-phosphate GlcNAc-1-phosphate transferase